MNEVSSIPNLIINNSVGIAQSSRNYDNEQLIDGFIGSSVYFVHKLKKILDSIFYHPKQDTSSKIEKKLNFSLDTSLKSSNFIDRLTVNNADEVIDFIQNNRDIIDPLVIGCQSASELFDSDTQLSLEVSSDPEYLDLSLRLYVRQNNYDDDIMEKIDQIYDSYYVDLKNSSADFLVTTDFQLPK